MTSAYATARRRLAPSRRRARQLVRRASAPTIRWAAYRHDPVEISPLDEAQILAAGYSSQEGQDVLLDRHVFSGRRGGVFVDVGAFDGVTFSNSYFLEHERAWSGLCLEPNVEAFLACSRARAVPSLNVAVSTHEGTAEFLHVPGEEVLGGLTATMDRRHRRRVERSPWVQGTPTTREVPTRRLDSVLLEAGVGRVDLLLVDVEGGELDVLRSANLAAIGYPVVLVENSYRRYAIFRLLALQGYRLLLRLVRDELYLPPHSALRPPHNLGSPPWERTRSEPSSCRSMSTSATSGSSSRPTVTRSDSWADGRICGGW